jgi:hypothetical protein
LSDIEQVANTAEKMAPLIIRIFTHLPIPWKTKQTQQPTVQQSQGADVAAIKELQESGLQVAYYKGPVIEVEAFEQAQDKETERLALNTLNTVSMIDPNLVGENEDLDALNPEFLRRWTLETCNVSDETLQLLWAKLLEGELNSPGSVSNDTMSIARDMNKARAEEFRLLCSAALYNWNGSPSIVVGLGSPGGNSLQPYGLSYDVLIKLAHHRLIVNDMNSYRTMTGGSPGPVFPCKHQGKSFVLRASPQNNTASSLQISGILFTPAGEELARVVEQIPMPEYTQAMIEDLKKGGWDVLPMSDAS